MQDFEIHFYKNFKLIGTLNNIYVNYVKSYK